MEVLLSGPRAWSRGSELTQRQGVGCGEEEREKECVRIIIDSQRWVTSSGQTRRDTQYIIIIIIMILN